MISKVGSKFVDVIMRYMNISMYFSHTMCVCVDVYHRAICEDVNILLTYHVRVDACYHAICEHLNVILTYHVRVDVCHYTICELVNVLITYDVCMCECATHMRCV